MTPVVQLIKTVKQKFLPQESSLVFNFEPMFNAWTKGLCTTEYFKEYCLKELGTKFNEELERRRR